MAGFAKVLPSLFLKSLFAGIDPAGVSKRKLGGRQVALQGSGCFKLQLRCPLIIIEWHAPESCTAVFRRCCRKCSHHPMGMWADRP